MTDLNATPRTDAEVWNDYGNDNGPTEVVLADFARKLECQLNAATEALKPFAKVAEQFAGYSSSSTVIVRIECSSAELFAAREALRQLEE